MLRKYFKITAVFFSIACLYIAAYHFIKNKPYVMDERLHHPQILQFKKGDFTPSPALGMGPGYHIVMSALSILTEAQDMPKMRIINIALNLFSLPAFFLAAGLVNKNNKYPALFAFAFFALNPVHTLLTYTDMFSVTLLLLAFFFLSLKNYLMSSFVALYSLFTRQTNAIIMFCFYLIDFSRDVSVYFLKDLIAYLKKNFYYPLIFLIFVLFGLVNEGFVMGKGSSMYHGKFISFTNVYFLLFLHFFLLLPENLCYIRKIALMLKRNRIILPFIMLFFVFFLVTFSNKHQWNNQGFFLRNYPLIFFTSSTLLKSVFFLPIFFSASVLAVQKLKRPEYYLLYPFAVLFLIINELVEPRYYIPLFAFYFLFKEYKYKKAIFLQTILNISISAYIIWGTYNFRFYP